LVVWQDDARAIVASDAERRVSGVVVHNQNFGAGKKRLKRPTQAKGSVSGVQQCRDWRHRGSIASQSVRQED